MSLQGLIAIVIVGVALPARGVVAPQLTALASTGRTWTQNATTGPSARYGASMVDETGMSPAVDLLFGGESDATTAFADTWTWDGTHWTQRSPLASPTPRGYAAMAYDPVHRQTVLFGGQTIVTQLGTTVTTMIGDTWVWDGSNWAPKAPTSAPSAREGASMVFDAAHQQTVLFGGVNGTSYMNDTWVWDGSNWTRVVTTAPPERAFASMAYDPASGNVVLFGGAGNAGWLGDTWTWNGSTWTLLTPGASPTPRSGAGLAYDTVTANLVLFGGSVGAGDTWTWDGATWARQLPSSSPAPRHDFAVASQSWTGALVVFGGSGSSGPLGDTWTWTTEAAAPTAAAATAATGQATVTWTPPSLNGGAAVTGFTVTSSPDGASATVSVPSTTATVTGLRAGVTYTLTVRAINSVGAGAPSGPSNAVTTLGATTSTSWLTLASGGPSARAGAGLAFDAAMSPPSAVLFGGVAAGLDQNDTWTWNGSTWSQLSPTLSPPAREYPAMAYDEGHNTMVLFGGRGLTGALGDTWTWDGHMWTPVVAVNSPPARFGASMVYDPVRGVLVLFGGNSGSAPLNDTWVWDGLSWSQVNPSTSPPARSQAAMAYDRYLHTTVLFGGAGAAGTLGDAWTWNGTTWTQSTSALPPARFGAAMAYDAVAAKLVLFSGSNGHELFDTWTWDGTSWTQPYPAVSPAARDGGSVTEFPPSGSLLVFGGETDGTMVGGLYGWATTPAAPTRASATAGVAQATVTWSPPFASGGSPLTQYSIVSSPDDVTVTAAPTATSATVTGLRGGTTYTFTVTASNQIGPGAPSAGTVPVTTPRSVPGAPTNVTATAGDQQATVSWSPPADTGGVPLTSFTVTPYAGTTAQPSVSVGPLTTSTTVTGLANGTTYTFAVMASNSLGTGPAATSNAVTPSTPPGAPQNVTATAADSQAAVSWQPPASTGGSALVGYTVTPYLGSTAQTPRTVSATTTNTTITGLSNGSTYTFSVTASNSGGPGPAASSNAVTPMGVPGAPGNVTAAGGAGQATVSWTAADPRGSAVTSYTITPYISATSQPSTTVAGTVTSVTITGLSNGSTYTFWVVATNAVGTGPATTSNAVTLGIPGAPPNVVASGGNQQATVSWGAASPGPITSYRVSALAYNEAWVTVTVGGSATSTVVTGLRPGWTYTFSVVASNSAGSGPAGTSNAVTIVGPPTMYAVTATAGNAQATLNWPTPQPNGSSVSGYTVTPYIGNTAQPSSSYGPSSTTVTVTGLSNGTTYTFAVVATNGYGDSAPSYSNAVTPAAPPGAPTNVSATGGGNQATVTWSAPTSNGGSPITRYLVTAVVGGQSANSVATSGSATSATVYGLKSATGYSFNVVAYNATGAGPAATTNSVTPTGSATTYASTVLADGPSLYWRLSEQSPNAYPMPAADSSGHGLSGLYDSTSDCGGPVSGGGALVNDSDPGIANVCSVTYSSNAGLPAGTSARTMEMWVLGHTGEENVLTMGSFAVSLHDLTLVVTTPSGTLTFPQPPETYGPCPWRLIDVVWDGSGTVSLYVDGLPLGSGAASGFSTPSGFTTAGGPNITIDDVAVYPSVLSAAQVLGHFNASGHSRPSAPGSVTATAGANQATVTWTAATAPADAVTRYKVTAFAGSVAANSTFVTASTTGVTLSGLAGGTAYTFTVVAIDDFGSGLAATSSVVTPSGATATYPSTILADHPSLYWRVSEPAGYGGLPAADSSGNGHTGYYRADTSYPGGGFAYLNHCYYGDRASTSGAIAGDPDHGVSNAASSYLDSACSLEYPFSTGLPAGTSARTLEMWINSTSKAPLGNVPLKVMSLGGLAVEVTASNQLQLDTPGGSTTFTTSGLVVDGQWHLLDATYDGASTAALYFDGRLVGTRPASGFTTASSITAVPWNADELAVYPAALTANQAMTHFLASGVPQAPSVLAVTTIPGGASLRWAPPPAGSAPITGYTITPMTASGPGTPVTVAASPTAARISGLPGGSSYTYQIAANDGLHAGLPASSPAAGASTPFDAPPAPQPVGVYVGYEDTLRGPNSLQPWGTGGNVVCQGCGTNDAGAILLTNASSTPVAVDSVAVDVLGAHWSWGPNLTVPANGGLILSGYDTSDVVGCTHVGDIPAITVTIGGSPYTYPDLDQVLIVGGYDPNQCGVTTFEGFPWEAVGGSIKGDLEELGGNAAEEIVSSCTADPVNTRSGNLAVSSTDLDIPGRGMPLHFARTYNSLAAGYDGALGFGWTTCYSMSLTQFADSNGTQHVRVHQENGADVTFTPSTSGGYTTPARVVATLVKNADGTFTYTRRHREVFVFSSSGQLIQERDLNGNVTSLTYNASGQLSTVVDPAQRSLTLAYTGSHLTSITDPNGRQVLFGYNDGAGNLTDVTDVGGGITHFTYLANRLLQSVTDPRGGVVANAYDASGRVTQQTDQVNHVTTFAYGPADTTITDPGGHATRHQYQMGELVSVTKAYGTSSAATWTYTYDPATLARTSASDPNHHTTTYLTDIDGNVVRSTDALNRTTTYTYDSLDDPLTVTDPNGVTTTMTYDSAGNLRTTSTPLAGTSQTRLTTRHYDDGNHPGDLTSVTDPDNDTTTFTYDVYGDVASETDPLGNDTTSAYNVVGWKTFEVAPLGNVAGADPAQYATTYGHDAFGHVTTTTDPLGHTTTEQYDADGNLTSATDADNHTIQYTYDLAGRLTVTTRADQSQLIDGYNPDGTLQQQADAAGHATTYSYDPLGNVTSVTDPLNRTTTSTYDGAGNRVTVTDPQSHTTAWTYDADNEVTAITYSDGVTPNVSSVQYDNDGQRLHTTDGTGTSSWSYDSLGRMASSTNGAGKTVSYGYDLRGHLTAITYPGQTTPVSRTYDAAGRWTAVSDWLGNTTAFSYDADSNLAGTQFPTGSGLSETYTHDRADRLTGITDLSGTNTWASFGYQRSSAGLLTATNSGSLQPAESYGYSTLDQLTGVNAGVYSYDAADNLVGLTSGAHQAFDAADQLCWSASSSGTCGTPPSGATTFTYDARGNRTAIAVPGGPTTALGYDQANHLVSYGSTATYAYNGGGLRMSKTVSGTTTAFVWSVAEGLPDLLMDGTTSYVYGPNGPLEQVSSSGTVVWFHQDQLGSTRFLTNSTGAVVGTWIYDAYGQVTSHTGSASTPLLFAGQYTDPESGLQYLRARYYDPATGQFITVDPLGSVTRSPYGYVHGDPLNAADPSGLLDLPFGFCLRNPFGGEHDNGGCHTSLSTRQGAQALQVALTIGSIIATAGAAAPAVGMAEGAAEGAAEDASVGISFSDRQLESQMAQHGESMGFLGSPQSAADRLDYMSHLVDHIDDLGTTVIQGTYRGAAATHYINPETGRWLVTTGNRAFTAAWELDPAQISRVLIEGRLP